MLYLQVSSCRPQSRLFPFSAVFPLEEHSFVLKSREKGSSRNQNCICLSGEQVLKDRLLGEKASLSGYRVTTHRHTYAFTSIQRFLMVDLKEFRTQSSSYDLFVLEQTWLFSPWVSQFFWQAIFVSWPIPSWWRSELAFMKCFLFHSLCAGVEPRALYMVGKYYALNHLPSLWQYFDSLRPAFDECTGVLCSQRQHLRLLRQ